MRDRGAGEREGRCPVVLCDRHLRLLGDREHIGGGAPAGRHMAVERQDQRVGGREPEAARRRLEALRGVPGKRLTGLPHLGDQEPRSSGAGDRVHAAAGIEVGSGLDAELDGQAVVEIDVLERAVAHDENAHTHPLPCARCRLILDEAFAAAHRSVRRRALPGLGTSRTSPSGRAAMRSVVRTSKTAFGVPAAHQTVSNRCSETSTSVRIGAGWPSGGTPPMAKPVASRTTSGLARRRPAQRRVDATVACAQHEHGPESSTKTSDFTIWPSSQPAVAAASSAVRLDSSCSTR